MAAGRRSPAAYRKEVTRQPQRRRARERAREREREEKRGQRSEERTKFALKEAWHSFLGIAKKKM